MIAFFEYITIKKRYRLQKTIETHEDLKEYTTREIEGECSKPIEYIEHMYGKYHKIISIYGIKTRSYKNIFSRNFIEFNSIFLGNEGIGNNDLKFCYS